MKKVVISLLCIVVAIVFAAPVLAGTTSYGKPGKTTAPMVTKKKAMGIVQLVDPVASTITIRVKERSLTFIVTANTKIRMGGREAKLTDIKKDAKVTIFYDVGPRKRIAAEIIAQVLIVPTEKAALPQPRPEVAQ
jgi:hypothetical protein